MIYLLIPYAAALALVVLELTGTMEKRAWRTPTLPAWVWILALVVSYAAQIAVLHHAALHESPMPSWRLAMPIPVLFLGIEHADAVSAAYVALGALQTLALVALYRLRPARAEVLWGAGAMLALSLACPVLASFDLYGYVHDAVLGFAGYSQTAAPLGGQYAAIDRWFVTPRPVIYGPLWIPIVRLMTGAGPTLLGKLIAYRACSAAVYVAALVLLRAINLPRRLVCAAALNPAFAFQYVANAHNDIVAIAIVLGAAALVRRNAIAAFALIAVAGTLKLPYAVLALPVVACVRPASQRYLGCAAAIAATVAMTWLGAGMAYVHAVAGYTHSVEFDLAHALPFLAALAAIAAAVTGARRLRAAVWLMPVFGAFRLPLIFPWYAIFGLPYALARHNVLRYLLVSFPLVTAMMTPELMRAWTLLLLIPLAVLLSLRIPLPARASPTTAP